MVVVVAVVVVFFLVFALACAGLMFPQAFERVVDRLRAVAGSWVSARQRRKQRRAEAADGTPLRSPGQPVGAVWRQRWVVAMAILILAVPPITILLTRRTVVLEDFRGEDLAESGSMIASLLRGEQLTPPPPPPPEVFVSAEIRRERPEIVTADRKWERIDPLLQQRVLAIYEVMRRQYGYQMVLVEGYRSPERQAELMSGGKATNAGAWQSCHQYGMAVDSAPLRDGKLQWNMSDAWTRRGYFLYGELAKQAGLEWGGDWRSIKDYVHLELAGACRSARATRRAELARG